MENFSIKSFVGKKIELVVLLRSGYFQDEYSQLFRGEGTILRFIGEKTINNEYGYPEVLQDFEASINVNGFEKIITGTFRCQFKKRIIKSSICFFMKYGKDIFEVIGVNCPVKVDKDEIVDVFVHLL